MSTYIECLVVSSEGGLTLQTDSGCGTIWGREGGVLRLTKNRPPVSPTEHNGNKKGAKE